MPRAAAQDADDETDAERRRLRRRCGEAAADCWVLMLLMLIGYGDRLPWVQN